MRILLVVVVMLGATAVSVTAQSATEAQIDKGREAVRQTCVPCHANIMRMIQLHKKSPDEWRNTVYSMIGRGAHILPEEIEPLAAFLAANGGRASQASAGSQPTSGLPEVEGKAILERTCQQCHNLASATKKPTSEDWKTVVEKMVSYGAVLTAADQQKLIEYLSGLTR
jgi:cytochrome c5